jgi:hypothetical protein
MARVSTLERVPVAVVMWRLGVSSPPTLAVHTIHVVYEER